MKLSNITFVVTDDCNFNCSYCLQKKEKKYISNAALKKAITFFTPFMEEKKYISFYGGEPLLAFDSIKYAVSLYRAQQLEPTYTVNTNGSTMTEEMLEFFDEHRFTVLLSFDGLTQDQDRKSGSHNSTLELMKKLEAGSHPGIDLRLNSVITPNTVNRLAESLQYIVESGATNIQLLLTEDQNWNATTLEILEDQLRLLSRHQLDHYKKHGEIPISNFRPPEMDSADKEKNEEKTVINGKKKNVFICAGARNRMAVTPDEDVWGCYQFHDYFKHNKVRKNYKNEFRSYSFGKLDDFIKNYKTVYPKVMENYALLKQDCFISADGPCYRCEDVESCSFCPVYGAYITELIGKFPAWVCGVRRTQRKVIKEFHREAAKLPPPA
jgi:uncharacterized protein